MYGKGKQEEKQDFIDNNRNVLINLFYEISIGGVNKYKGRIKHNKIKYFYSIRFDLCYERLNKKDYDKIYKEIIYIKNNYSGLLPFNHSRFLKNNIH